MPRMSEAGPKSSLAKLLLIADGKLGKTYYAAMAAKAGFNVLYLDGDVGSATIGKMIKEGTLSAEDASRIYLIDVRDTILGGVRDTRFVEFMNELCGSVVLKWNESENRIAKRNDSGELWEIRPAKMTSNDLIVIDSWTGYTESVMLWCGRANGVDITTATLSEMRAVYGGGGLKSTEMLQFIRSMPCNVIVLAHPDEFSHMTKPEGRKAGAINEKDLTVDWTKMIPKTTSKPQGLQMAKYFSDVAWMELSPDGKERRLNFKTKNDRVSGGHFDDAKSVDEYSFVNLVKQINGAGPTGEGAESWLTITQVEAQDPANASASASVSVSTNPFGAKEKVLDGTVTKAIGGMSSFLPKK